MTIKWRKSSRSNTSGGQCVELANLGPAVGLRDSKNPESGHLELSRDALAAILGRIKEEGGA